MVQEQRYGKALALHPYRIVLAINIYCRKGFFSFCIQKGKKAFLNVYVSTKIESGHAALWMRLYKKVNLFLYTCAKKIQPTASFLICYPYIRTPLIANKPEQD